MKNLIVKAIAILAPVGLTFASYAQEYTSNDVSAIAQDAIGAGLFQVKEFAALIVLFMLLGWAAVKFKSINF